VTFKTKIITSRLTRHWSSEARPVTLLGPIRQEDIIKGRQVDC